MSWYALFVHDVVVGDVLVCSVCSLWSVVHVYVICIFLKAHCAPALARDNTPENCPLKVKLLYL